MAITRLKYITNNLIQAITPTISTFAADSDYPVANLTNWRVSKRAGFDTAKSGELVFDLGSAQTVDACILFNHNLTSGATVKIQGNATDSWGAPSVDETITYVVNDMYKEFTGGSYRYWRLTIADAGRAANDIKLGEMILGSNIDLTRNPDWNITERLSYNNVQHVTAGGNKWSYALYNNKSWVMSFAELLAAQNTLVKNLTINSEGNKIPFSIIFESAAYYVRVSSVYETERPFPADGYESGFETNFVIEYGISGFEITEESRGIVT